MMALLMRPRSDTPKPSVFAQLLTSAVRSRSTALRAGLPWRPAALLPGTDRAYSMNRARKFSSSSRCSAFRSISNWASPSPKAHVTTSSVEPSMSSVIVTTVVLAMRSMIRVGNVVQHVDTRLSPRGDGTKRAIHWFSLSPASCHPTATVQRMFALADVGSCQRSRNTSLQQPEDELRVPGNPNAGPHSISSAAKDSLRRCSLSESQVNCSVRESLRQPNPHL